MPTVRIEMYEGRTREQKARLAKKITEAVVESLDVKPDAVRVKIFETLRQNSAVGGVLRDEA